MTFSEFCTESAQIVDDVNVTLDKSATFIEAFAAEYRSNLRDGYNYVIEKGGTESDAKYLKDKATEGYIGKIKATIQSAYKSTISAIHKMINAIKGFFNQDKVKKNLDEAKDISSKDNNLKSVRMQIPDIRDLENKYNKKIDKAKEKIASVKGKRNIPKDDDTDVDKSKIIVVSIVAAATAIGVGLGLLDKVENDVVEPDIPSDLDPDLKDSLVKAYNKLYAITISKTDAIISSIKTAYKQVASAIKGNKLNKVDPSAIDDIIGERAESNIDDVDSYILSLLEECESLEEDIVEESGEVVIDGFVVESGSYEERFLRLLNAQ